MLFQKVKTPGLAHVAYVLGDEGEALVVDPLRMGETGRTDLPGREHTGENAGLRDGFIARRVRERLPRPPYFRTMEAWNLEGGSPPAKRASAIPVLRARDFAREMKQGLVLDTRAPEAFAGWRDAGMPLAAVVAARAVNTAARTR